MCQKKRYTEEFITIFLVLYSQDWHTISKIMQTPIRNETMSCVGKLRLVGNLFAKYNKMFNKNYNQLAA